MPDRWEQVKLLFDRALECDEETRTAFLQDACEGDIALYAEVVSLVQSYRPNDSLLDDSPFAPSALGPSADSMVDRLVGSYRLVRRIGKGGMGSVYLAVRADEQFQKRAAVKLVASGAIDGA